MLVGWAYACLASLNRCLAPNWAKSVSVVPIVERLDELLTVAMLLVGDWETFLAGGVVPEVEGLFCWARFLEVLLIS